ncbi:hypothetical protein PUN28_019530 [Cardiocondyla obscurior]|uniref:NSF AAA+ ATPase lid domain-containing protein n=1 Tax=Cardiocondyla obscurior TaxID=286306 RepID=A0AAW2E8Y8_9HYME
MDWIVLLCRIALNISKMRMKAARYPTDELSLSNCAIINAVDFPDDVRHIEFGVFIGFKRLLGLTEMARMVEPPYKVAEFLSMANRRVFIVFRFN